MNTSELRVGDRVKRPGWQSVHEVEETLGERVWLKGKTFAINATDWIIVERRIQKGDKVRHRKHGTQLDVQLVDNGVFVATNGNAYLVNGYDIVLPATARKAIVALIENGVPRPATRPFVHPSLASAEAESRRLAEANPGQLFGVYELASISNAPKPIANTRAA